MTRHFSTVSFVAGVIVGALLTGAWFFSSNPDLLRFSSMGSVPSDRQLLSESALIALVDQSAGPEVVVESVTVPPPGVWVAVREMLSNDLGNVLGAARVGGPRTNITVSLLRATLPGKTYAVELYRDDNEGAFDPAKNSVYVDFDTGARVVSYFETK